MIQGADRAFTLVELLIVVLILGILSAVVIPEFSDASEDARLSALRADLKVIRQALERYKLEHRGAYPNRPLFTEQMTQKTDIDGNPGTDFGPYLLSILNNPFTVPPGNDISIKVPQSDRAWFYRKITGEFKANDGGSTNGIPHSSL